jgi:uncharacterized Ntn-hydrolase superfamily protein
VRKGTYSVVARDPGSGDLGVAVQSHWFSVGSIVSWAEPGVGAVATQSIAEVAYGPRGLDLMREGVAAADAVPRLLAGDELAQYRQVGVVDAHGEVAVHTGSDCIPHAGHVTGEGFACQANMMARPGVPEAMAAAFEDSSAGSLAERLLAALDGAEAAGGDVRGRQSAALLVVPSAGEPWRRVVDLRVEDHDDPLAELRRLHRLHRAYELADRADRLLGDGRAGDAGPLYEQAASLAPESDELLFWAGLGAAQAGDMDTAVRRVREASRRNPRWPELLGRLSEELAPGAAAVRRELS